MRQSQQNAQFSPNTNVYPAFGNSSKIHRNRMLTKTIMRTNYGIDKIGRGEKPIETTNDPERRPPQMIINAGRVEMSIAGRMRGMIRPANPGLVRWKNPYWQQQRPPYRQPIGPFTQASLPQQSVMYRLSDAMAHLARGGK